MARKIALQRKEEKCFFFLGKKESSPKVGVSELWSGLYPLHHPLALWVGSVVIFHSCTISHSLSPSPSASKIGHHDSSRVSGAQLFLQ